jgi:hypothetical protein
MNPRSKRIAFAGVVFAVAPHLASDAFAQIGGKPNPAGRSAPAPNPLEKLDPWKRRDVRRDVELEPSDTRAVPPSASHLADVTLGQRVRGRLEERGEVGVVRFLAPEGARLRFSIACEGGVGSTNVALLDSSGAVVATFAKDGRRFELRDHPVPRDGWYSVRIVHDHGEPMSFVMSTSGEYPSGHETTVELSREGAVTLTLVGFPGRSIAGAAVLPLTPRERVDVRFVVSDRLDEKLGSFEGRDRTASDPRIEVDPPIDISRLEPYRCDVWLLSGRSPQRVKLRMEYANPKPGSGTVELRKRS